MSVEITNSSTAIELSEEELDFVAGGSVGRRHHNVFIDKSGSYFNEVSLAITKTNTTSPNGSSSSFSLVFKSIQTGTFEDIILR